MIESMKPKHLVLQEMTATLLQINPMKLGRDNPLEYELEALSILSRFTEAALHLSGDEAKTMEIASGIVRQTFDFWFENIDGVDHEAVAKELLSVFRACYEPASNES